MYDVFALENVPHINPKIKKERIFLYMRRKIQYLVTKDPKIMECVSDNTEWLESVKILSSNEKNNTRKNKAAGISISLL